MKKVSAGLVCILLAVIIALCSVGCDGSGNELTYNSDNQTSSSDNQNPLNSSQPSATESTVETVLYQLTTQQGQTVQVLSTTAPTTEVPTMNYEPVDIPTMPTTYVNTTTYVPPTHSYSTENQVTTKAPTTTQPSTEAKIKYVTVRSGYDADAGMLNGTIQIYVDKELFSGKVKANKGSVTLNYGSTSYKANCKVLSELYAGEQIEINVDIPSALNKVLETSSGDDYLYIDVPKGLIVTSDNISNRSFKVTFSLDSL